MLNEQNYDNWLNRQIDDYTDGTEETNSNCCDAFIDDNECCSECGEHCISLKEERINNEIEKSEDMWDRR